MEKKYIYFEKYLETTLYLSFFLIFMDSYQISEVPLTWIGNFLLVMICLVLFYKENVKLNFIPLIIVFISLTPTIFNFFNQSLDRSEIFYTAVRLFSYLAFVFAIFVFSNTKYQTLILKVLKHVFFSITFFSLYIYLAQLFNFYEPVRNRPGTGIFGYDIQSNFWSSDSHRLVGTFREPIFLVSILFPTFVIIHYKLLNSKVFYCLSAILFGLTKSELCLIFVVLFMIVEIVLKKVKFNNILFFSIFLICFLTPIKECDISPSNIECPEIVEEESTTIEKNIDILDNNSPVESLSNEQFEYIDRERSDIISFTSKFIDQNVGFGFQRTNKIYTEYLAEDVFYQMYLTNRTLPDYLNTRYLARSFGTGRYFLTYENINIQNNFLFNLFSMGMFYAILLVCIGIYFLINHFQHGLKIILILSIISLASVEDLLPIFGLYLSLMFTMDRNEN
tara:strand:- start:856 stop:2202 length:1347 start_codon:yes stop_codon:yes gene_type:complete